MQRSWTKFMHSIGNVIWRYFVLDGAALADPACLQVDGGAQHLDHRPTLVGSIILFLVGAISLIQPYCWARWAIGLNSAG